MTRCDYITAKIAHRRVGTESRAMRFPVRATYRNVKLKIRSRRRQGQGRTPPTLTAR